MVLIDDKPLPPEQPTYLTAGSAFRFCCVLACAVLLAGCGTKRENIQPEAEPAPITQPVVPMKAAPPAAPAAAPDKTPIAQAPTLPVSDENNIYFVQGAHSVTAAEKAKLRKHAEYLAATPKERLNLIAHTDDFGSRSYNLAIAEQRLSEVRRILIAYGAPGKQIRRHRGEREKMPATCRSSECRQQMRRVELVFGHQH